MSAQDSAVASATTIASDCYICMQEGTPSRPLLTPCDCKGRPVHRECLARWQLHQSGKSEETTCRFCFKVLPDWRPTLLGDSASEDAGPRPLLAKVIFNNQVHILPILPGPEGKAEFKRRVNELFGLNNRMFDVNFEVKVKEDKYSLQGLSAYEAATRCAVMSARRDSTEADQLPLEQQQVDGTGPASAGPSSPVSV
ncbi:hypothetical protein HYH02_014836 [Chlamydomonas schloesseri]|uniref:RING-CH-type domain-containing protein n=1 Tax=Chlamydomonas schloesseri TaxID=2026947 RepID=A0A835SIE9_9CHLO|nr:hypothetical protein HYH02_014836 [Chlamydomonas schloesseri]|eukprot:KAG2426121.1 hypothetical protein HYH02_014836 [Chlamydomonas schloesseri]